MAIEYRRAAIVVAVAAGALALTSTQASATRNSGSIEVASTSAATPSQQRAMRFRESMGFPESLDVVQKMEAVEATGSKTTIMGKSVASADITTELGVPLTLVEMKEIDLRQTVIDDDASVVRKLVKKSTGEEPAGVFMDNRNGGFLIVSVKGGVANVKSKLLNGVTHPDRIKVTSVDRSMADLTTLAAGVGRDRGKEPVDGVVISGFAIDERRNSVSVDAVGKLEDLQSYYDALYGQGSIYVAGATPVL